MIIDFNSVTSTGEGSKVYPDGTYYVQIKDWERTESKNKKTPQIKWTAEILKPKEFAGGKISEYNALTENSLWKIANLIYGCGVVATSLKLETNSSLFEMVLDNCKGRKTYWRNQQRTNDGKLYNDIVEYVTDDNQETVVLSGTKPEEQVPDSVKEVNWDKDE